MKRILQGTAALSAAFTLLFILLYENNRMGAALSLAITFGTAAYHLGIRLFVGALCLRLMKNRADYTAWWFRARGWEKPLYQKLRVKRWKGKMPSYTPEVFDPRIHSWEEIAQAMCQSELVHEIDILCSFLPLFAAIWFGAFPVFLITSVLGAVFDGLFVIMQRYNRPRITGMMERKR